MIEKEYTTKEGYKAVIKFLDVGHRCGYIHIPCTHKAAGIHYYTYTGFGDYSIQEDTLSKVQQAINDIEVHGGLTYAEYDDNSYVFGFDCAHCNDAPDIEKLAELGLSTDVFSLGGTVRTLEYCIEECNKLSEQLFEIDPVIDTEIILSLENK